MIAALISLLLLGQAPKPVALCYNLKAQISRADRDRLRLLPGFPGFQSAIFYRLPDSGYRVDVTCAGDTTPRSFHISSGQFYRIQELVFRFDATVTSWAEMPTGYEEYRALWRGIGDWANQPLPTASAPAPVEHRDADHIVNVLSGAACGSGVGAAIGVAAGTRLRETRRDSVYLPYTYYNYCMEGSPPDTGHWWKKWTTDVFELDSRAVPIGVTAGAVAGGAAGIGLGAAERGARAPTRNESLPPIRDLTGVPISETELRSRMEIGHRALNSLLGLSGASAVGLGLGYIASIWAHSWALRNHHADSLEFKGLGNSLTIPILTIWLGTALKVTWLGYQSGELEDRRDALIRIRRERFGLTGR